MCSLVRYRVHLQERDAVVGEVLGLHAPVGLLEGVGVTPRVVVESEEVAASAIRAAVHVRSHLHAVLRNISGRVTNRDLAVTAGVDVRPHVTVGGLDIRGALGRLVVVDDLISREEHKRVVVLLERIDGSEDALKVDLVVRPGGLLTVDGVERVVDIQGQVDASVGEGLHALIVVGRVVDAVDTDGVQAKLLELGNVTLARLGVGNGVFVGRRSTGLVVDTTDVETLSAGEKGCDRSANKGANEALGCETNRFP